MKFEDLKIGDTIFKLLFDDLIIAESEINVTISSLVVPEYVKLEMTSDGCEVIMKESEEDLAEEYCESIEDFNKELHSNLLDVIKQVGERYHILNRQRAGRGNDAVAFNLLGLDDTMYIVTRRDEEIEFYSTKVTEVQKITNKKGEQVRYRIACDSGLFLASNTNKYDNIEAQFSSFDDAYITPDIYSAFEALQKMSRKAFGVKFKTMK